MKSIFLVSKDPEAIVAGKTVRGEANVARLIARAFPTLLATSDDISADDWMDRAHAELLYGDRDQREAFVRVLDQCLARSGSLSRQGKELSTADFVVWSYLIKSGVDANAANVKKWSAACRSAAAGRVPDQAVNSRQRTVSGRGRGQHHGKRDRRRSSRTSFSHSGSPAVATRGGRNGQRRKSSSHASKEDDKKEKALNALKALNVKYELVEHPPVRTVDDMMPHLKGLVGLCVKNFFLKDKKGKLFVLTAPHDKEVSLTAVGKAVNAKDLRFAQESLLMQKLDVEPGCLTPLALINDLNGEVQFLATPEVLDGEGDLIAHPLVNTASVVFSKKALLALAQKHNHAIKSLNL